MASLDKPKPQTVRVDLGERSYDIVIGLDLISRAGELIAPLLHRKKVAIVTDKNVAGHHLDALHTSLDENTIAHDTIIVSPGEGSKSFATLESVCDQLLRAKIERADVVLALGGGIVGDLTGFAASVLRRGISFIQIPTTLLAQVDSSVGGKTGINTKQGKNLIGAFHQPRQVIADITALDTLPARDFLSGFAEVIKYGLIDDPDFFTWLDAHGSTIMAGDYDARIKAVTKSCKAKARIVAMDEKESGVRALLNLGHTFGHALEAETGFSDRLLHGEGVAIGMMLAHRFSTKLGLCSAEDTAQVEKTFSTLGLPTSLAHIRNSRPSSDVLVDHMFQDKKVADGKLTLILTKGIGKAFIAKDVDPAAIRDFLNTQV